MQREAHIPILLWLPAALVLHALTGGGASEAARTINDRMALLRFARNVRAEIYSNLDRQERPTEVELFEDRPLEPPLSNPADEESPAAPSQDEDEAFPEAPPPEPARPKPPPAPTTDEKKSEPPPEPKKPEPPPEKEEAAPLAAKPMPVTPPAGRIAVQNDPSLDKNQEDNPDAPRIADHANKTDEETMAHHRSYDQNAPKPTGGGEPNDGPEDQPGNADVEERGHSAEAPGEGPPKPGSETGPDQPEREPIRRSASAAEMPKTGREGKRGEEAMAPREAGSGEKMPETVEGPGGSWSISPDGGDGRKKQAARKGQRGNRGREGVPGVVMPGELPKHLSVDAYGLQDALGADNLRAEQERARNVRLNKHRGKFDGIDFQKYRAAIENYDPKVKLGNQTSLNAARVPFASYINRMHNRIHPIFADGFLASLSTKPGDRLADMSLVTHLEIILDGRTGKLISAGIVKPSGVTTFEVAALRSIEEAGPFGKPPEMIVSPDGRVYVHWEFYRDPYYACTSRFARPFLLKSAPDTPQPVVPPAEPPPSPEPRYGSR